MTAPALISPKELAVRWSLSPEKIRQMFNRREIGGIRIGKLIRFRPEDVEQFEQSNTVSPDSVEASPSSITRMDAGFAARLARMTGASQRPALVSSGERFMLQSVDG